MYRSPRDINETELDILTAAYYCDSDEGLYVYGYAKDHDVDKALIKTGKLYGTFQRLANIGMLETSERIQSPVIWQQRRLPYYLTVLGAVTLSELANLPDFSPDLPIDFA